MKGDLFILSAPSGAGKTSLVKVLLKKNNNLIISTSHTTRRPRENEIDGKDYYFVTQEEFDALIKKNDFYEFANIFDNNYGTHKETVIKLLSQGKDVLFDIDWQGTLQLKKIKDLNIVCIFILPPNIEVLRNRLSNRHRGEEKLIEKRMNRFNEEVSHWNEYNYVVINDDLNICYDNILKIITSEKKDIKQEQNFNEVKKNRRINQIIFHIL